MAGTLERALGWISWDDDDDDDDEGRKDTRRRERNSKAQKKLFKLLFGPMRLESLVYGAFVV